MKVLVTGGAGYIGSHTVVELVSSGHEVIIADNLSNSSPKVIDRLESITGRSLQLVTIDILDKDKLSSLFARENFDAVMHFAGLKAVGESVESPLTYYRNNLESSLSLLEVMEQFAVRKLIFSSSATVYGSSEAPYTENSPAGQGVTSPYGQTKYMIEQIIRDTANAQPASEFTILRYFNPIGAHESGLIGEHPHGKPNNLMPYIAQVAAGRLPKVSVFGNDYSTPDGTGVRDYIHVVDLAKGHLAALDHLQPGVSVYNLGSGRGISVMEMIKTFEAVSGQSIPYAIAPRRAGDLAEYYASVDKARQELGWATNKTIEDACRDSWHWQANNPDGYDK